MKIHETVFSVVKEAHNCPEFGFGNGIAQLVDSDRLSPATSWRYYGLLLTNCCFRGCYPSYHSTRFSQGKCENQSSFEATPWQKLRSIATGISKSSAA
jgi:hypothetical protein